MEVVETIDNGKTTTMNNDIKVTMINETIMVATLMEIEGVKTHARSALTMIIAPTSVHTEILYNLVHHLSFLYYY